jgi:predicted glycosyltransferase
MRFLFYSHDGLGLGHTRRHIAVASALIETAPEASVLLATGADDISRVGLPAHIEVLKLPGLQKIGNEKYGSRRLQVSAEDIRSIRAALLRCVVKEYRPDVVLVDKHPFGAKGEFRAALKEARKRGARCVLGLRDVLDSPETVANEWGPHRVLKLISSYYDEVLVYGQQEVYDPVSEYGFPLNLAARTHFCGYVVNPKCSDAEDDDGIVRFVELDGQPVVLATAGGGEDGLILLETFLRTSIGAPWKSIVVAGPMTPERHLRLLRRLAQRANARFCTYISRLPELFSHVTAVVCMGGYNTLVEAVSAGAPTVCVPRVFPRTEQSLRASAFERLGLIQMILPEELNPTKLNEKIIHALRVDRREIAEKARETLVFDGARQAASHLLAAANQQHGGTVAERQTLAAG